MLTKRLLTAIIAIPLLIASIYLGSKFVFMFIVMLCVGFALYEFYKMNIPNHKFIKVIAILAGLAVVYFVYYYQDNFTFGNTNYSHFSLDDKKSCKETIELYEKVCNIESTQDKELKNICKELLKELKNIC